MIRNWPPQSLVAMVAMLAIAGTATTASAQDKLDRALREGKSSGKTQHVILKAKPGYEAWARELLAQNGKNIDAELPSIGALAVELTAGELDICKSAVVTGCSEDSYVSPSAAAKKVAAGRAKKNVAVETPSPAVAKYSAPAINTLLGTLGLTPSASFGYGVTVALIDSGIYPSTAFAGRIKAFYDFTDGGTQSKPAFDDYGHGTHVAGLIGGLPSLMDVEYEGVAPSVEFVGLKVLDQYGGGRTSNVIRAIEFAIANKRKFGIDIINLSLCLLYTSPSPRDS